MRNLLIYIFFQFFLFFTTQSQTKGTLTIKGQYGINRTEKNKEIAVDVYDEAAKINHLIFNKGKFNVSILFENHAIYKIKFYKKNFKTIEYTIYTNDADLSKKHEIKTVFLMTKNLYGIDYKTSDTTFNYNIRYQKKYDKFILDSISLLEKQKNIGIIRKEFQMMDAQDSLKDIVIQNAVFKEQIATLSIENLKAIQLSKENEILKNEKDLAESNLKVQKREMELLSLNSQNRENELRILKQQKEINKTKLARLKEQQEIIQLMLLKKKKEIELEKEQGKLIKKELELSLKTHETNKRRSQIKNLNRDNKSKELEIENQRRNKFIFLTVSLLFLVMSILIFKKFRQTNSQKKEIELQKHLVDEKNREILDSITYAKRIQSAILPQPKLVKEFLEDSFILYKPKDIVAGDFYWLEVVENTVLFAAADCTGHGVPGAMVSVVCNNGLNRAVREFGLTKPNEILDKTRELVIQEFEKSDEDVKDGMDISLVALRLRAEKQSENEENPSLYNLTHSLLWSGANNPLWILRNNEILEYKADKQPIGKYSEAKPFNCSEIQLEKNDIIYIFTDGFQDQFGGPKEKKYRVSQMRELFLCISDKSMEEQRKLIDASFEAWKGQLEQVDDVCVIGVRI